MKVVIIGSGNVATVLAKSIHHKGFKVDQVLSTRLENAVKLANEVGAQAVNDTREITTGADLYIIAVPDAQIQAVAGSFKLNNKLVVHTAGSVSKDVLATTTGKYGVLYPLQSLRKEMTYIPRIPVLVDGSNINVNEELFSFASSWADSVQFAGDEQRLKTHVAAVIASNFTNHLYSLTEAYCKSEGLDFETLKPLIGEVANRLQTFSPADVQTGPAARGDVETINKHLALLQSNPRLKMVYQCMTESILGMRTGNA